MNYNAPLDVMIPRLGMEQDYFTELALQESRRWIQDVTGKQFRFPDDPRRSLQDGILLCELLMALKPGCIRKVNRLPTPVAWLDNLTVFQNTCRDQFGLQDCQLFDIRDLEDLRLRVVVESEEAEENLRYETLKRLKKVVITLFWLGKIVRSWFHGAALDFSAFTNLVDVPMTPLYQSSQSTPTGSTMVLSGLENRQLAQSDDLHYYQSPVSAGVDWSPTKSTRFDSLDRSSAYGSMPRSENNMRPTSFGSTEIYDDNSFPRSSVGDVSFTSTTVFTQKPSQITSGNSGGGQLRVLTGTGAASPDRSFTSPSRISIHGATQRQVSEPSPGSRSTPVKSPSVFPPSDPLYFVKTDVSPLSEDAKQTIDQLQRQKQQLQQNQRPETENWQENLSSWKSRRISQRKSETESTDDAGNKQVTTDAAAVNEKPPSRSGERHKHPSTEELEDSVLSAFGFLRDYQTVPASDRQTNRTPQSAGVVLDSPLRMSQQPSLNKPAPCGAKPTTAGTSSKTIITTSTPEYINQRRLVVSESMRPAGGSETPSLLELGQGYFAAKSGQGQGQGQDYYHGPGAERQAMKRETGHVSKQPRAAAAAAAPPGDKVTARQSRQIAVDGKEVATVYIDRRLELGVDISLSGGREYNQPITVDAIVRGRAADHCGLTVGDELLSINGAPLDSHYVDSVITVINEGVVFAGTVELVVRRRPPMSVMSQPQPPSPEGTPPPLPNAPPPALPSVPPPSRRPIPVDSGFNVEGDEWSFIDDEFSRDLDNILEEELRADLSTGSLPAVGEMSSEDDVVPTVKVSSTRKTVGFLDHAADRNTGLNAKTSWKSSPSDERMFAIVSKPKPASPTSHDEPLSQDAPITSSTPRLEAVPPRQTEVEIPITRTLTQQQRSEPEPKKVSVDGEPKVSTSKPANVDVERPRTDQVVVDNVVSSMSEVKSSQHHFTKSWSVQDSNTFEHEFSSSMKSQHKIVPGTAPSYTRTSEETYHEKKSETTKSGVPFGEGMAVGREIVAAPIARPESVDADVLAKQVANNNVNRPIKLEIAKDSSKSPSTVAGKDPSGLVKLLPSETDEVFGRPRTSSVPVERVTDVDYGISVKAQQLRESFLRDLNSPHSPTETGITWKSMDHVRSASLSSAPSDSDVMDRVSKDMEKTLPAFQRRVDGASTSRVAFNLEAERKKMEEWAMEQERIRKEKFDREQFELKLKREKDIERAKKVEEERRKEETQLLSKELSRQKELEDLAKKRELELKAKQSNACSLSPDQKTSDTRLSDSSWRAIYSEVSSLSSTEEQKPVDMVPKSVVIELKKTQSAVKTIPVIKLEAEPPANSVPPSTSEQPRAEDVIEGKPDYITAEVQFTEIRPEVGHFEFLPNDSDDHASSGSGTPVPQRLQFVRDDARSSTSSRGSNRGPADLKLVEVCDVKSVEATEWRKKVLQECKPKPSGWFWMENHSGGEGTGSDWDSSDERRNSVPRNERISSDAAVEDFTTEQRAQFTEYAAAPEDARLLEVYSSNQPAQPIYENVQQLRQNYAAATETSGVDGRSRLSESGLKSTGTYEQTSPSIKSSNKTTIPVVVKTDMDLSGRIIIPVKPSPPPRSDSIKSPEVVSGSQQVEYSRSERRIESTYETSQTSKTSWEFETSSGMKLEDRRSSFPVANNSKPVQIIDNTQSTVQQSKPQEIQGYQFDSWERGSQDGKPVQADPGAAVDMLYSYHQMRSDDDVKSSNSSLNARCSPAMLCQNAPPSPLYNNNPDIQRTHF